MVNYDFNTINTVIPVEDVLAYHGVHPNSKGGYRIRLCKIYTVMSTKVGEKVVKVKEKDKESLEAYSYEKVES